MSFYVPMPLANHSKMYLQRTMKGTSSSYFTWSYSFWFGVMPPWFA